MINFFRKKFPFGIERTEFGLWKSLNRNLKPLEDSSLGFTDYNSNPQLRFHLGCLFRDLEEVDLIQMACCPEAIIKDKNGKISQVFLYNDGIDPTTTHKSEDWSQYFDRLKILSKYTQK